MHTTTTEELNPWEAKSLEHHYPDDGGVVGLGPSNDALIWPGLYSKSGLDVMNILTRVVSRPDPKIDIGPVDCSVSLVICEPRPPDSPIIYASEGFTELTGYSQKEVLGRDCRFLQTPNGSSRHASRDVAVDAEACATMRQAVEKGSECQIAILNFRKDGAKFTNLVTIVPIRVGSRQYLVGFHGEA